MPGLLRTCSTCCKRYAAPVTLDHLTDALTELLAAWGQNRAFPPSQPRRDSRASPGRMVLAHLVGWWPADATRIQLDVVLHEAASPSWLDAVAPVGIVAPDDEPDPPAAAPLTEAELLDYAAHGREILAQYGLAPSSAAGLLAVAK